MANSTAMAWYDSRRVTRAQLEAFLNQSANDPNPAITSAIQAIPEIHRQKLLDVGRSVCRIDTNDGSGTGWYLGGEWVVSNTHVICDGQYNSLADRATFVFPSLLVQARPRRVLFTELNAIINLPSKSKQKDLALIHVPEIVENMKRTPKLEILPLVDGMRQAGDKETVYLIHYGSGIDEDPPPQQFSVCDNVALLNKSNEHGNVFTKHSAHCRPGSSGAPLLVYNEPTDGRDGKFVVAGVNCYGAGPSSLLDSPGFAWWLKGEHWINNTVFATDATLELRVEAVRNLQGNSDLLPSAISQLNDQLRILQEKLESQLFRMVVPLRLPDVEGLFPCPNVIWSQRGLSNSSKILKIALFSVFVVVIAVGLFVLTDNE